MRSDSSGKIPSVEERSLVEGDAIDRSLSMKIAGNSSSGEVGEGGEEDDDDIRHGSHGEGGDHKEDVTAGSC